MDLMVDNNVILDHLLCREPFCRDSEKVFYLGMVGEANEYLSTNMLTDLFYILRKEHGSSEAQDIIEEGLSFVNWVGVGAEDALEALKERWDDLEDCLVARCARKVNADYIITRNVKDFEGSPVKAITPAELFELLEARGVAYEVIDLES